MKPHEQRVVDELTELNDRREKLLQFLGTHFSTTLPDDEQERLRKQLDIMDQYAGVLRERIGHFPKESS